MNNLSNSFTDDELRGMITGNNPVSNAYRELLAYREAQNNNPCIGYVSKKAIIRMIEGVSRFCSIYPQPKREYRIAVYLDQHYAAPQLPAVNSPVIPDGWALVPIEPTENMMLHKSECQHHAWDEHDCTMRQTRRLVWANMIAAAPKPGGNNG